MLTKIHLGSSIASEIQAVNISRITRQLVEALVGLFFAIFLLIQYGSIQTVLFFYIGLWTTHLFLVAPGAMVATRTLRQLTDRTTLLVEIISGVFLFFGLIFFQYDVVLFSMVVLLALTGYRVLVWLPADGAFALNKQYGLSYRATWQALFSRRDRRILFFHASEGAQAVISTVIWPVFIWLLLDGNILAVGLIGLLVAVATVVLRVLLWPMTNTINQRTLVRYGSLLSAVGWIATAFVQMPFQIFAVAAYRQGARIFMRLPVLTDGGADAGHYFDEYSVLRRMAFSIGCIVMLFVLLILFNFFSVHSAFIVAAIIVLLVNVL